MNIIKYEHHGAEVSVIEENKGRHRENCLCWQDCRFFYPDDPDANCPIASILYNLCVLENLVTPVWECAKYKKKS